MVTRRTLIRLAVLGGLCLIALAGTAEAQQIRGGEFIEARRDSARTGLIRTTTMNLDTLALFQASRRYIDSLIALQSGADYVVYRLYGVLGASAARDSVNLQVGVNGVYEAIRPNFNVTTFNFSLLSTSPTERLSTFDGNKPTFGNADSLLIFRVSRDTARPANQECAITAYKLPKAAGPDQNTKTVGTFYDMHAFPLSVLPLGSNLFFTVDVVLRRQP